MKIRHNLSNVKYLTFLTIKNSLINEKQLINN